MKGVSKTARNMALVYIHGRMDHISKDGMYKIENKDMANLQ